jgi:hypothetical protein
LPLKLHPQNAYHSTYPGIQHPACMLPTFCLFPSHTLCTIRTATQPTIPQTHCTCPLQVMLPKVEHLRIAADKARAQLDASMAAVLQAEAHHPLTTPTALTRAGLPVPRVLVRGSEGTVLMQQQAVGGVAGGEGGAGAGVSSASSSSSSEVASVGAASVSGGGAGGGGSAAGPELVAVPAVEERREMYDKDQAETGGWHACVVTHGPCLDLGRLGLRIPLRVCAGKVATCSTAAQPPAELHQQP